MEQAKTSPKHFLTPKQFMEKTGLSRNTVYQGIKDGSIPSIRISRRKLLIPEDALEMKLHAATAATAKLQHNREGANGKHSDRNRG